MANITLTIPENLHKKLKQRTEIRWSEVVRKILQKNIEELEVMDKIVKKSKLTKQDIEEIGGKIKKGIARRHGLE
ncbi:hypothetical protein COU59_00620 [Candidatus Pacearchaeota archaeon CG10_big_fil_rev_8_21_14_0_10_34_12]|nr:MAG: hypothetical protein COU59_00620 [Candidatus Pacearchaeota archaeon CG10_big_fil_rev_8_21_14_0_10_34_12]